MKMNANTLTDDLLHLSGTCIKELIWNSCFSLSWMERKIFFVDTCIWAPILLKQSQKYGCLFVAKLSWKKKLFFQKIFVFFTKYTLFTEKNIFIWKKSFILKNFFTEQNINENVKNMYLIWEISFYTENVCVKNKI